VAPSKKADPLHPLVEVVRKPGYTHWQTKKVLVL